MLPEVAANLVIHLLKPFAPFVRGGVLCFIGNKNPLDLLHSANCNLICVEPPQTFYIPCRGVCNVKKMSKLRFRHAYGILTVKMCLHGGHHENFKIRHFRAIA